MSVFLFAVSCHNTCLFSEISLTDPAMDVHDSFYLRVSQGFPSRSYAFLVPPSLEMVCFPSLLHMRSSSSVFLAVDLTPPLFHGYRYFNLLPLCPVMCFRIDDRYSRCAFMPPSHGENDFFVYEAPSGKTYILMVKCISARSFFLRSQTSFVGPLLLPGL